MDPAKAMSEQAQYLTFTLDGDDYAVSLLQVKEIIAYDAHLTKVPNMPASVRGVINLRGSVVPVVDLAVKLGLSERPITKRTCIVIVEVGVEAEHAVMGLIADTVSEVIDLSTHDIEPPPAFGTRLRMDYLKGLGKVGKRFVFLLDIDRVLSTQTLLSGSVMIGDPPPDPGQG
ncbi:MAG: chemotaxis protein CheW [Nitrospiria bacterium]